LDEIFEEVDKDKSGSVELKELGPQHQQNPTQMDSIGTCCPCRPCRPCCKWIQSDSVALEVILGVWLSTRIFVDQLLLLIRALGMVRFELVLKIVGALSCF
jgi:hypothetical protein